MIPNLGCYWKLKLSCPSDKAKTLIRVCLTPKSIFFLIYPLSNVPRKGKSSLWIQEQFLGKVKDLSVGAKDRYGDQRRLLEELEEKLPLVQHGGKIRSGEGPLTILTPVSRERGWTAAVSLSSQSRWECHGVCL
nr:uncharacterized protein LOC131751274 isoform X2 [Kogia breviceps]